MMNVCSKCGASGENVRLKKVISDKGIICLCGDCASEVSLPVIQEKEEIVEPRVPVRERLVRMNRLMGRDASLRSLIDSRFDKKKKVPEDLIANFHWIVQRVRRSRKMTRLQVAGAIHEDESSVKMIEQGFLPENNYKIIAKIEEYFGLNLRKPGTSGFPDTSAVSEKKESSEKYSLDESLIEEDDFDLEDEEPKKFSFRNLFGFGKKKEEVDDEAVYSEDIILDDEL